MRTFTEILEAQGQLTDLRENGYRRCNGVNQVHLLEAARLMDRVLKGDRRARLLFQEAMSTSDFPILTGNILERTVLSAYAEAPASWPAWCKRGTLADLTRVAQRIALDRGGARLDGPILPDAFGVTGSGPTGIAELTSYPERRRSERHWDVRLYKYGARMAFSWELFLADDLDQLKNTPTLFGQAARSTEEHLATQAIAAAGGPNPAFFNAANTLQASAVLGTPVNAPLSITALAAAITQMVTQVNLEGEPINIQGVILVVPPAQEITARNIINATQTVCNDQGGTIGVVGFGAVSLQRLVTNNWAQGRVRPVTNWWLPIVNPTNGNSAWYLFADPNNGRPAVEIDFLRGHETPEIYLKASNQVAVGGGGETDPMGGDFDTDQIIYKVRHCVGGGTLDPRMALVSNGTGV